MTGRSQKSIGTDPRGRQADAYGKNMQDVSFVVLDREKSKIEQLAVRLFRKMKPLANLFSPRLQKRNEIGDHFFFFHAPLVIVILAKNSVDGILAAQNMEFVA